MSFLFLALMHLTCFAFLAVGSCLFDLNYQYKLVVGICPQTRKPKSFHIASIHQNKYSSRNKISNRTSSVTVWSETSTAFALKISAMSRMSLRAAVFTATLISISSLSAKGKWVMSWTWKFSSWEPKTGFQTCHLSVQINLPREHQQTCKSVLPTC